MRTNAVTSPSEPPDPYAAGLQTLRRQQGIETTELPKSIVLKHELHRHLRSDVTHVERRLNNETLRWAAEMPDSPDPYATDLERLRECDRLREAGR